MRIKGWTLIEVMVVMAIAAILVGAALPSYQNTIRVSRRHDARVALLRIMQLQEAWRANHLTYTGTLADLNLSRNTTENGFYTLSLLGQGGTGVPDSVGYRAQAVAIATKSQSKDATCQVIYLNMNAGTLAYGGKTGTTGAADAPNSCW